MNEPRRKPRTDLDGSERRGGDELRRVLDSAPVNLAHVDARFRTLFVNEAYAARFGLTPADVIGKPLPEIIGPAAFAVIRPHLEEAMAGRRVEYEQAIPLPGGERIMRCIYVPDPGPPPVGVVAAILDVTDRARAVAALRESESFYRQTLDSIPGMTFTNTPDGACEFVSEQWVEFTGVPAERHLGYGWLDVLHPDDQERVIAAWQAALVGRAAYDVEGRLRRRDGVHEWFKVRCRAIRDASGAIVRWFGVSINIDDLKRAEAALRESEHQVRRQLLEMEALYDTAPLGLCAIDHELRFRQINGRLAELNGLSVAAHLGKTVREVVPGLADEAEEVYRRVIATGKPVRVELRSRPPSDPNVEHVWDERWYPIHDTDGSTKGVGVVVVDVTDQRRAEEALRDREQRLRLALDFAGMGTWEWHIQTGEVDWGAKTRELFGGGIDARTTYDVFEARLHPDDVPLHREFITEAMRTGVYDNEYRVVLPGGEIRWIAARGRLLHDAHGRPTRMLGVITDVTERKHAELAQKDADRRKDEFLAMLAHELRNPLAPIRTGLQVLRMSPAGSEGAKKVEDMMERQLGHMVRLIDDLLDVSRVSQGKVELKRQRVTLQSVVESAVETSQPQIVEASHELVTELPKAPLWLDADPTRMAQVVGNLLSNAAKYTPRGGRITLTGAREGDSAVIRVRDTGVGIPRSMLAKVFDLFTQVGVHLEHAQGGLGIGLSLARKLVEMHGGTITAESPGPGCGATFTVRLPLAADPLPSGDSPRAARGGCDGLMRVLVVDDNCDAAESMAILLDLFGYRAEVAFDGLEALAAARRVCPDVVLLDIGMPKMSGYEVARRFREDPALRHVVLVALTGWGSDDDKRRAREAGFDFHLTKPIDVEKVRALLEEIRGRPRATSEQ